MTCPMNEMSADNRRKFARLDLALTVSYRVTDEHGTEHDPREALSSDISESGLRLMTPTAIETGSEIDVEIMIGEDNDNPIAATGEVVWQNKLGSASYETGVIIRSMPTEDRSRFMQFVFDQMAKLLMPELNPENRDGDTVN